ncbi:MAG: penicillin-binding transpeptidase domain-containing protein [Gemmatimonadetes bacterium]|nr:penicillin-binding transpeptidase domain-containing protein [Gemmatimonadota bacterium]
MRIEVRHIRRQRAICLLGGIFVLILTCRLAALQVWTGDVYSARAKRQHEKRTVLQANRGRILDRKGRVLATNLEAQSFFVNKVDGLDSLRSIAVRFSGRDGAENAALLQRLQKKRFVWLARKVFSDPRQDPLPKGVGRIVEMRRTYPMGELAGQVLGYTDIDNLGIEGVELACNLLLEGEHGDMTSRRDARGEALGALGVVRRMPEDGEDVMLTLDVDYQSIVEEELAAAVSQFRAVNGIAVVTSPRSGEILAMANVPLYDPNHFGKYDAAFRRNRAVTDIFEPGSTFKVVAVAGGLEEGLWRREDRIFCEFGRMQVPGGVIRDTHPCGWLTVQQVVEESSNIGTVKIARKLKQAGLYKYVRLFGFGNKTTVDLPGEVAGNVKKPTRWSGRTLASMSIGQEIGVTALQMAMAYGAIANGGRLMAPRIYRRRSPDGVWESKRPHVLRDVVSEETAGNIAEILEGVVLRGTGKNAQVPGYRVAGKTGTAQRAKEGGRGYDPNRYVSSFIGFLPVERAEFVCIVIVDGPKGIRWGSKVAAPVFSRIMQRILSLRDTEMRHRAVAESRGDEADKASRPVLAGLTRKVAKRVMDRQGIEPIQVHEGSRLSVGPQARSTGNLESRHEAAEADSGKTGDYIATPNVLGVPLRQAVVTLTSSGLSVSASGSGRVVSQTPGAGMPVARGTTCNVVCSPKHTPIPNDL